MSKTKVNETGTVSYRRPLNNQQIKTLHLLYLYRFCTSKQLAYSLNRPNHKAIQNKLQILEAQGLIGKRYDKSYKLAGRSAEYYITPKGARALEKAKPHTTNTRATNSLYKNKTVSDDFIRHCITVTETAQNLKNLYGNDDKLILFTKSYMTQSSCFPAWKPDIHLAIRATDETPNVHYFVDVWDGTKPFFVSVRKARNYVNFKAREDWFENEHYPAILTICDNELAQKKLNRQIRRILNEQWDDELIFATTTTDKIQQAIKPADRIWSKIYADDNPEVVNLRNLLVY
jgi:DNA-binding PadR family transcriptional regulator